MSRHRVTDWIRVDEAAAALSVSRRTLYRWIRAGRLPAQRRAGALLVPRSALPVAGAAPGLLGVRELFADTPDFADTLLDVYRSRRGERPRRVPALGGRR